jgi:predicted transcriptional regulator
MIIEIFGENCIRAKVFDLLLSHPNTEYTITDMSECAEIARPTLYKFIDKLVEYGIVTHTRRIGPGKLYKINMDSSITQALNSFQNQLADIEIENEMRKYQKNLNPDTKPMKPFEEIVKNEMVNGSIVDSNPNEKANDSFRIVEGVLETTISNYYYLEESSSETSIISTENSMPRKYIAQIYGSD